MIRKTMRSKTAWLCTMYACPEGLDPKGAIVIEKRLLAKQKKTWDGPQVSPHPFYDYRKVPTRKLMQRLDVLNFNDTGPLKDINIQPEVVRIPLSQHIGAPSSPIVKKGQKVKKYEIIAESAGNIGVPIHASIDGVVQSVDINDIKIQRN